MVQKAQFGVVGVGTGGAMALWQLAKRGADVVGFEQFSPGHGSGAAGGETRLFRVASEGPAYIPMTRRSVGLWRELEADADMHLFDLNGSLSIGTEDIPAIQLVRRNIDAFDIRSEILTAGQLRERYPQLPVDDNEIGVLDLESGHVLAQPSLAAAAEAGERMGARILRDTVVREIVPQSDGIHVRIDGDEWVFEKVILSAGAWMNNFLSNDMPHLEVQRIAVHWYPLRNAAPFALSQFPILERSGGDYMFYAWPSLDGASIKVALGLAIDHVDVPDNLSQSLPSSVTSLVDGFVRKYLPDAIPSQMRQAVCADGHTADRDFLIGPLASDERIIVLGGFSGHGFKMCPATGKAAADYALDGHADADMAPFTPSRFKGRNLLLPQRPM